MSGRRTGTWLRGGRGILASGAAVYLTLLPMGSYRVLSVGDAHATGSDLLLAALVLLAGVTWVRSPGFRATVLRSLAAGWRTIRPFAATGARSDVAAAVLLLALFAIWTMASAVWGSRPEYAVAKGLGYVALTAGVAVVAWSGLEWDRALKAWLTGTALAVGLSLISAGVAVVVGDAAGRGWARRALHEGGSLGGLPGPRLRGPFLHPNALGDYLLVSGVLLWAAWPLRSLGEGEKSHGETEGGPDVGGVGRSSRLSRVGRFSRVGRVGRVGGIPSVGWLGSAPWRSSLLAPALVACSILTLSSAWLAAGIVLMLWGRRLSGREVGGTPPLVPSLLRGVGGIVAATTLAALVFPLRLGWGSYAVVTSGGRVRIWEDAFQAFVSNPVTGVGATPALADAVDPVDPGAGTRLWDAHSAYLDVLGQFGLVGMLLLGGALFFLVRGLLRSRGSVSRGRIQRVSPGDDESPPDVLLPPWRWSALRERARKGVLVAVGAVAVHGLVVAGEDFRHWWALLAVAGLVAGDAVLGEEEA